jgi:hypothetical protein
VRANSFSSWLSRRTKLINIKPERAIFRTSIGIPTYPSELSAAWREEPLEAN